MSARVFVDTHVLIYGYDVDAGEKHARAKSILKELWASRSGALSLQVLQEFYVNVTRKLAKPLSILVLARSGAGKSSLQDALCAFTPPEDLVRVTRLTGQALFYKDPDSLKSKVLAIAEVEGAQAASYSLDRKSTRLNSSHRL